MKRKLILPFILMLCISNKIFAQENNGFEAPCSNPSNAFFAGCFPNWISVSGSADVQSNIPGISPFEGNRYVHMYVNYAGNCLGNSPDRTEGIAINSNFLQGVNYRITYAIRWESGSSFFSSQEIDWILTNGLSNQTGPSFSCLIDGSITPPIPSGSQIIRSYRPTAASGGWILETLDFTPNSNFTQLWLKSRVRLGSNVSTSYEANYDLYLDGFNLTSGCPNAFNFEPNENIWSATTIQTNTTTTAGITSPSDQDYFRIVTTTNTIFTATLTNLPLDYDLELLDAAGNWVGGSGNWSNSNETITVNNLPPGTYYLHVYGYAGNNTANQCYNLNVNTVPIASPCINANEPNDNTWNATSINPNSSISAGIGVNGDIDYYTFTTTTTGALNINLTNLPGDYDIELRRVDGGQLIGSGTLGGTSNENINVPSLPPGTYLLKVWGYAGAFSINTCYNLELSFNGIINTGCRSEYDNNSNNTTGGAVSIPFNTDIRGLIETSGDIDFYRFNTSGGNINITLTNLPINHDYDIKLRNSSGVQINISQAGGSSNESINMYLTAGLYFIEVYGYAGANNSITCYTLRANDGNDGSRQSNQIAQINKSEIKADENKLEMNVYPNPAYNLLQVNIPITGGMLQVTDAKGVLVITQQVYKKQESIDVSSLQAGVYFIRVQNGKNIYTTKFIKQ
jgi:hypothetical protein